MNDIRERDEVRDDDDDELESRAASMGDPESKTREPLSTKDFAAGAATGRARQPETAQPSKGATPLFNTGEAEEFRSQWMTIQTRFVDEPRKSVELGDELVATTMKRLAEIFAAEREKLEREWDKGDNVSTEDLRVALQRYRSFFDRLLSV
ncbi:MAG: hypothetical protein ABR555_14295 [Pyrinomonadaceae bacterium]